MLMYKSFVCNINRIVIGEWADRHLFKKIGNNDKKTYNNPLFDNFNLQLDSSVNRLFIDRLLDRHFILSKSFYSFAYFNVQTKNGNTLADNCDASHFNFIYLYCIYLPNSIHDNILSRHI